MAGCGHWGKHILRDLLSLNCIVDVADPDPEARIQALEAGATEAVEHVDDFSVHYDGYVIAAGTSQHAQLIERLAKTGRPVFCEKPLTCDPLSAQHIAKLDNVFVMHKWLYHPGVEAIMELARGGNYGNVKQITTRRLQWTLPHSDVDAIWALAPHDLSIIYGILGFMPEPQSATGLIDPEGSACSMTGILGEPNTPNAIIHVSANWPALERVVAVTFEECVVVLDDPLADHIKLYLGDGRQTPAMAPYNVQNIKVSTEFPLLRELRAFIGHVAGGPPPKTDAVQGALIVDTLARLRALAELPD